MGRMKRMLGRTAGVKMKFVPMTVTKKVHSLMKLAMTKSSVAAIQKFSGAKKSEVE